MEVACYRIDKGIIIDEENRKCDNLILFIKDKQAVFIELKGEGVRVALEQIFEAVQRLGNDLSEYEWHGRVIAKSCIPDIRSEPKYRTLFKELKKHNLNATLTIHEKKHFEQAKSLIGNRL